LDRRVGSAAFGEDVAGYAAGRLDYPEALFEVLGQRAGLAAGTRVLEIGPGTGQASRRLLDASIGRLVAVEPDPALAEHLRGWNEPRLEVRCAGFGPEIAGDASFDLVVAATSFHWLESDPALVQVMRLLKPGGSFAMWWNVFHEPGEDPLFDALFEGLPRPPSLLNGWHYSLDAGARCRDLAGAGFVDVEHVLLSRRIEMTPASLRALYSTFSAIRQLAPAVRAERLDRIEQAASRRLGERFVRTFRTPLYLGRARG
jgi:SAM-dependent methyltransferase